jgi:hypothetical protein
VDVSVADKNVAACGTGGAPGPILTADAEDEVVGVAGGSQELGEKMGGISCAVAMLAIAQQAITANSPIPHFVIKCGLPLQP